MAWVPLVIDDTTDTVMFKLGFRKLTGLAFEGVWPIMAAWCVYKPAYVIMMVADVLAPNGHQAITTHHIDSIVTKLSHKPN